MGRTFHGGSNLLEVVGKYTSDPHLLGFASICCEGDDDFSQSFAERLYECLAEDKPMSLSSYLSMYMMVGSGQQAGAVSRSLNMENMKVAHTFCSKISILLDKPAIDHGFVRAIWSKMKGSVA